MADQKKVERGKGTLSRILAKLPESKRAAAATLLEDSEALDALEELGGDGLRQDEFSRAMAEAEREKQKGILHQENNQSWWNKKVKEIADLTAENETLKRMKNAGGGGSDDPNPNPPPLAPAPGISKEDVARIVEENVGAASRSVVPLVSALTTIGLRHMKDFNEVLDIDALIQHCQKTQTPVDRGGYESFVKDKVEAKKEADRKAEIEAAEKRGEERARAAVGATAPYPVGISEPGTLSGLTKKGEDKKADSPLYGVAAAVNEYNKAVAARG